MKPALLPDGRLIQFPDNMHDDEIDRAVRAIMGVDEQQKQDAAMGVIDQLQQIGGAVSQMAQEIAALAQSMQQMGARDTQSEVVNQIASLQNGMQQQVENLGQAINSGNSNLMRAVTSPREVITPDNRRFVSTVKMPAVQDGN